VKGALRRLRIVGVGDQPSAEDHALGLDRLNQLIAAWVGDGVNLRLATLVASDDVVFLVPPAELSSENRDAIDIRGTWNATTNTPTLASGDGTAGYAYRVSVAGSTTLDDVTSWAVNDYLVYDGTEWLKCRSSERHIRGIEANLALELCDDYGKQPLPTLARAARDAWIVLQADYIKPPENTFDAALSRMGRWY
jgi:hypothetical protein